MILRADARYLPLADESVQCVVTSPPYWGLRDYGAPGQLGLEPTPEEYVADMVAVFREVKRVLRPDGTAWLNLGDSYAGSGRGLNGDGTPGKAGVKNRSNRGTQVGTYGPVDAGVKPKDLVGIPWRVAFALQDDGWWLRSDIIWHKPNPMPESVTDRPTKAHEYVFLLAKSAKYYYDSEAVKEPAACAKWPGIGPQHGVVRDRDEEYVDMQAHPTRNRRDVWAIATQPFPGAHFATMPPRLVEPCIKAGTSERGCCPNCGATWERVAERTGPTPREKQKQRGASAYANAQPRNGQGLDYAGGHGSNMRETHDLGWRPGCGCDAGEPVPCVVLDPFSGAGTVGLVASRLGREYVGCDISQEYNRMAQERIRADAPLFAMEGVR